MSGDEGGIRQFNVGYDDDGIRLDRWFKRHLPDTSFTTVAKWARTGQLRVDGARATPGDRIKAGQTLRVPPPEPEVKDETGAVVAKPKRERPPLSEDQIAFAREMVIHKDLQALVLNKPPGLATQGGSGLKEHVDGMLDQLTYEKTTRPKLVHRLDKDTSGVLLIARTAQAASGLSVELARRETSKIYWALVKGVPKEKRGLIKGALAKEGVRGKDERMAISDDEDAKSALTEYAVMGQAGNEYSWVAAKPVTGRTHQIRVHLASIGTPIMGDFKYGGTEVRGRGAIPDKLHLHARSIDLARPDGGRLQVTAPLPAHMLKSWSLLGFDPDDKRDPFPPLKKKPRKS